MLKNLQRDLRKRIEATFAGVHRYVGEPQRPHASTAKCVWKQGTTRLLDYGGDGPPLLFIPSLINRYTILDLTPRTSLAGYLKAAGQRCFVVDWDMPGDTEQHFGIGEYITERLLPILDYIISTVKRNPAVIGYCMGGMLALALAHLRQRDLAALALLATPWDYHAEDMPFPHSDASLHLYLSAVVGAYGRLPSVILQSLFVLANPDAFQNKFRRYAAYGEGNEKAALFVALEQWTEDGVDLAGPVARECIGWWRENHPARGQWKVNGDTIRAENIMLPTFVAVPENDRIVPASCAMPLAAALLNAELHHPAGGHVGMVVGGAAEQTLWKPLQHWLSQMRHA